MLLSSSHGNTKKNWAEKKYVSLLARKKFVEERRDASKPIIDGPRLIYTPYKRSRPLQKFPFIAAATGRNRRNRNPSEWLGNPRYYSSLLFLYRNCSYPEQVSDGSIFSCDTTNLAEAKRSPHLGNQRRKGPPFSPVRTNEIDSIVKKKRRERYRTIRGRLSSRNKRIISIALGRIYPIGPRKGCYGVEQAPALSHR